MYVDGEESPVIDGLGGLFADEFASKHVETTPLSMQQLVESECGKWSQEWLVGAERLEPVLECILWSGGI